MNGIKLYRFAHYCYRRNIPLIPRIIQRLIYLIFNAHIPYTAEIGKGTILGYGGMGVVIHSNATIGNACMILQQVTIGTSVPYFDQTQAHPSPTIGNNVYIGSGAKILGAIHIGDGAVIGANAVVTRDVPPNSLVLGIPGKIIKQINNKAIVTYD